MSDPTGQKATDVPGQQAATSTESSWPEEGWRRPLNLIVAVVAIAGSLPLWIVIAALIRLTSRGPILYTQTRIGLDKRGGNPGAKRRQRVRDYGGRPFKIYKFRTMKADAELQTGAVWATENDCRVTSVGRFLRRFRLDELPQLVNVLRGDMNVVGPRPERPTIFAELQSSIPDYQQRQRVRPGITGHAQINLEYDSTLEDVQRKLAFDLEYIERQSVLEDLRIMLMTIPVMLFRRGSR